MNVDLKLELLSDGTYDIVEGDLGDLDGTEGYDTAILTSILSDARASEAEVPEAKYRRGWLGDLVPVVEGYQLGSLLWTVEQRKRLTSTLNQAVDAVKKSLSWIQDLNYAKSVEVSGSFLAQGANIAITITAYSGETDTINFPIWKATVNGN